MTLNFALLDLVDARVAAGRDRTTIMGTLSERTSATRAMVTFDGSSVAVPVKIFSDVTALEGDRVGLVRFGTDWVVVGTFAAVQIGTYIDYSSTFTLNGSTGAPTQGTSVYLAEYMWLNRQRIRVRIRVDFLTGFVQGSGVFLASLPFAATATSMVAEVGQFWLNDSGVAIRGGTVTCWDATRVNLWSSDTNVNMSYGGTPFDNVDDLIIAFEYEPDV
jgi:hypothetical protein